MFSHRGFSLGSAADSSYDMWPTCPRHEAWYALCIRIISIFIEAACIGTVNIINVPFTDEYKLAAEGQVNMHLVINLCSR